MLRYKTETKPGLVTLYDIRPGNGAGQFLQPRSPHGAICPRSLLMFSAAASAICSEIFYLPTFFQLFHLCTDIQTAVTNCIISPMKEDNNT